MTCRGCFRSVKPGPSGPFCADCAGHGVLLRYQAQNEVLLFVLVSALTIVFLVTFG